jgi:hypothetical protein
MQFEALPFSADSAMSIGSRKSLRERVFTFCGTQGQIGSTDSGLELDVTQEEQWRSVTASRPAPGALP